MVGALLGPNNGWVDEDWPTNENFDFAGVLLFDT